MIYFNTLLELHSTCILSIFYFLPLHTSCCSSVLMWLLQFLVTFLITSQPQMCILYIYLFYQPTGNLYFSYWGLFNIRLFHFLWLCVTFVKYFNTIHSHGALMLHLVTEELNLSTFVYLIFNNNADSSCFYIKYESQLSETCREVKSTIFPSELQRRRRIKSKYCGTKT